MPKPKFDPTQPFDTVPQNKPEFDPTQPFSTDAALSNNITNPDVSYLESLLRGSAQGATLGFADELTGGAETLGDVLTGNLNVSDFMDAYRKHRDESRAAYESAEKANPATYTAGNIGGGIASAVAMPGLNLAKGASLATNVGKSIALGGLTGLGGTKADITQGQVAQAIPDVALGMGLGAAIPLGFAGAGKAATAIKPMLEDLPLIGHPAKAFSMGLAGENVITKGGRQAVSEKTVKEIGESLNPVKAIQADLAHAKSVIQNQASARGTEVNVADEVKDTINKILSYSPIDEDVAKAQASAIKKLRKIYGDEVVDWVEKRRVVEPGKIIQKAKPSSTEALKEEAARLQAEMGSLGQSGNVSVESVPGTEYEQLLQKLNTPEGEKLGKVVTQPIEAAQQELHSLPQISEQTVPMQSTVERPGVLRAGVSAAEPGVPGQQSASDLVTAAREASSSLYNKTGVTTPATEALTKLPSQINQQIENKIPELTPIRQGFHKVFQGLESLGLDKEIIREAERNPEAGIKLDSMLSNLIKNIEDPTIKGVNVRKRLDLAIEQWKQIPGVDVEALDAIKPKVIEAVDQYKIAQAAGSKSIGVHMFSNIGTWLANAAGLGLKKAVVQPMQSLQSAQTKLPESIRNTLSVQNSLLRNARSYSEDASKALPITAPISQSKPESSAPADVSRTSANAEDNVILKNLDSVQAPAHIQFYLQKMKESIANKDSVGVNAIKNILSQTEDGRKVLQQLTK